MFFSLYVFKRAENMWIISLKQQLTSIFINKIDEWQSDIEFNC